MEISQIKELGKLIVTNSTGQIKAFLFGSTARSLGTKKGDFPEPEDIDLLFEVDPEVFGEYCRLCQNESFNVFGRPSDPYSMYWEYYSPASARWEIIKKAFNINSSLTREIIDEAQGRTVDIIILPFGWEENEEVLGIMNSQDPEFSENVQGDRKLLFEK